MKTMEFETPKKEVSIEVFSKTKITTYLQCPEKAYQKERHKKEDVTRPLLVGKCAHELFAKKVADRKGVPYTPKLVPDPSIVREAKLLVKYVNLDELIGKAKIIGFENFVETTLPNSQKLLGVFDLTLYRDNDTCTSGYAEFYGPYIEIIDFKTGFKVSQEVDNEAIIYATLAAKNYGLPVLFKRFSGRGKDNSFEHFFDIDFSDDLDNENSIASLEQSISIQVDEIKRVVEGFESPIPKAGAHCSTCPFLDQCLEKGYAVDDIDGMITSQRLYAAKAKELKNEIKAYNMAQGGSITSEVYTTFIKETSTPKLLITNQKTKKKKAITKKDFVRLLSESNMLDQFVSALDIKYTPEVINKAIELGLELGETVKRDLVIELTTDYEEGEFDEEN